MNPTTDCVLTIKQEDQNVTVTGLISKTGSGFEFSHEDFTLKFSQKNVIYMESVGNTQFATVSFG